MMVAVAVRALKPLISDQNDGPLRRTRHNQPQATSAIALYARPPRVTAFQKPAGPLPLAIAAATPKTAPVTDKRTSCSRNFLAKGGGSAGRGG